MTGNFKRAESKQDTSQTCKDAPPNKTTSDHLCFLPFLERGRWNWCIFDVKSILFSQTGLLRCKLDPHLVLRRVGHYKMLQRKLFNASYGRHKIRLQDFF